MSKFYVLYDERAIVNPSDASVLDAGFSRDEYNSYDGCWGRRVVLYEYDRVGNELENGRIVAVLEEAEVSQ